jgi:hypothetical protein
VFLHIVPCPLYILCLHVNKNKTWALALFLYKKKEKRTKPLSLPPPLLVTKPASFFILYIFLIQFAYFPANFSYSLIYVAFRYSESSPIFLIIGLKPFICVFYTRDFLKFNTCDRITRLGF